MSRLIEADIAEKRINDLLKVIDEICKDVRERSGDDWVCGLCEYDGGAFITESGDYFNECPGFDSNECFCMKEEFKEKYTDPIPAVDAVPVVHGRWEWLGPYRHNSEGWVGTCPVCKKRVRLFEKNFCPNCGADMRERKEESCGSVDE